MRIAITTVGLTLYALLCAAAFGQEQRAEKAAEITPSQLVGSYTIVESEKSGEKTEKEKIDGVVVHFTEEKIVATDKDKNNVYACTYKLDTSKSPIEIHMTSIIPEHREAKSKGLIKKEGDKLVLIYTLPDHEEMPKEFKTKEGQVMVTLQKTVAVADKPDDIDRK